jgi:hypothetical protein
MDWLFLLDIVSCVCLQSTSNKASEQNLSSTCDNTGETWQTARSTVPPLDIVTQMVIERDDGYDDGQIGEISGDMIIFYDDIEIVEHSSTMSSTESDSISTNTRSYTNGRSIEQTNDVVLPPPVPARALKPMHLLNHQQQTSIEMQQQPIIGTSTKINRTYELEKPLQRKINADSVNNMLNRTEHQTGPTAAHRLRSARHFVGKVSSDESSSRSSSVTTGNATPHLPISTMVKSQTLPVTSTVNNEHSTDKVLARSLMKTSLSTLPIRSVSSIDGNNPHRSTVPDTSALVRQIQNSLSRNSLHEHQNDRPLSISTKDLRTFVSSTYSPTDENMIDDNGIIHRRQTNVHRVNYENDEQDFKRQARLSKSFHNVSEYKTCDQYPTKGGVQQISRAQPSKSVENSLNQMSQRPVRSTVKPLNFPPMIASASFTALNNGEDNARLLVRQCEQYLSVRHDEQQDRETD